MADVHSTVLGKFLEYSFDGLMANVVAVDQEGNFVVVVHLPGGFLFSGDDAGCYHASPVMMAASGEVAAGVDTALGLLACRV